MHGKRVWVAGHRGLVGSALVRRLEAEDCEVLTAPRDRVDLRSPDQVTRWMAIARPQAVFVAAARVGGIHANDTRPAEFLYDNLLIEANIVEAARHAEVEKLLFLGSSCIYPRDAPQPLKEEALLTGPLEPTNQWYAIAKIAGIKLAQAYRRQYGCDFNAAMPTNLYGPGDNFDLLQSHVVPALMAKAHRARIERSPVMTVWGTGTPLRELLYVDDAADGLVFLMQHHSGEDFVNLGTGVEISIAELAATICRVVGFAGRLEFDRTKPDGTPRKVMDVFRLHSMGWTAPTGFEEGLERTYRWYVDNLGSQARAAG
ncbi:MAG: GDP-L-fucose synthase [Alphaproteobacteria bacterium]|nr:GDP-L-fucose synthase [Alphaproteobacteria bacterium]